MSGRKLPTSWRSHHCHDCGRRTSRSRCSDCRKARDHAKRLAHNSRASGKERRRAAKKAGR